ncbi:MAG: hypothetical protein ACE5KG_00955, partial [Nitrososphaerales archaeon]
MVWGTVGGPTDVQALLTGALLYRTDTLVFPLIGAAFVMNSLGYIFYRLGYFRIFLDRLSRRNDVLAVRERPSVFTGNLRYIGSLALISVGVTYVLFAISWNYTIDPVIPLLIVFIALLLSLKRVHG